MILTPLLLAAASLEPSGASGMALATARVIQGERIALRAPVAAPDRLLRQTRRVEATQGGPVTLHLVEFH